MKAVWNGSVIAESDDTVIVEGNHYFPATAVERVFLKQSETKTHCPWKGTASYFHVVVDGKINHNAAWYYPDIKAAAKQIEGYLAFWNGVDVYP